MFCAISGVTPEDPVISKRSGLLFEKRLIEKFIEENGTCPVTKETLSLEDIIPLKTNKAVKPRPIQALSIPGMLGLFQNEWDAVVLSNYHLEQQLHNARQELSHALYQHDAACRVIARLKRERDEARALLSDAAHRVPETLPPNTTVMSNGKRGAEMELEPSVPAKLPRQGITSHIIEELTECNSVKSSQRKKRQISPTLTPPDELERFTQISSHPLHKTVKPGIISIDIHPSKDWILTGGADSNAVVFDRTLGQIVATLSGHTKRVTSAKFVARDDILLTASADKTVRIWQGKEEGYEVKHVLRDHSTEVKAVTVHPTNNYFVSASADKAWAFYDLDSAYCITQIVNPAEESYTTAAFHPDGLILGAGTAESVIRIWDIKSQANVATFESHSGPVVDLSFSENGYYLATAASDGVKIWDLRKLRNFRTFNPYDASTPTNSVQFDHSGNYLALAGSDVRVYQVGSVKTEWNHLKTFPDLSGTGHATCVRFGRDASYLAVGSNDRNLRILGSAAAATAIVIEEPKPDEEEM